MLCILNVGTVPTLCILYVGTVPTLCILNVGTVPTFSHSHILLLREERAECVIRKMWCNIHNQEARKITTNKKRVWTRNNKTGL